MMEIKNISIVEALKGDTIYELKTIDSMSMFETAFVNLVGNWFGKALPLGDTFNPEEVYPIFIMKAIAEGKNTLVFYKGMLFMCALQKSMHVKCVRKQDKDSYSDLKIYKFPFQYGSSNITYTTTVNDTALAMQDIGVIPWNLDWRIDNGQENNDPNVQR